jgi:hypothetical protein
MVLRRGICFKALSWFLHSNFSTISVPIYKQFNSSYCDCYTMLEFACSHSSLSEVREGSRKFQSETENTVLHLMQFSLSYI